jgi:hypothetical protein
MPNGPNSKPENNQDETSIGDFWRWFAENAPGLSAGTRNSSALEALDRHVMALNPKLSWEIGPGRHKPNQFVVSPNLDRSLREETRRIVSRAPLIEDWEFYSTRQLKEWKYQVELASSIDGPAWRLDASEWQFVLLLYPDGMREVILNGNIPNLSSNQRWQAAAIVLESILGEDMMMEKIDEFDLTPTLEPRFEERKRPLDLLRAAIQG